MRRNEEEGVCTREGGAEIRRQCWYKRWFLGWILVCVGGGVLWLEESRALVSCS